MAKITAPAPPFVAARWRGGKQTPRTVVIHGTVSPCAPGGAVAVARFFANHSQPTSAHYTVDPREVIQSVGDHSVAFHCGHNQDSIGVELCDPQAGPDSRWADGNHVAMLERAAELVARLCLAYEIPLRRITVADLKAGRHGICGHADMSNAFHQSTHTDPGAGFPWDKFMALVRSAAADITHAASTPPKPAPKPKPAKKKTIRLIGDLTIAHGNLFKDNTHKAEDVSLIDRTKGVHVFGLNEAYRFRELLKTVTNYRVIQPTGSAANNAILLRNDVTYLGDGSRKMCEKVGTSPQRDATWACYEHAGKKWAHVQTHTNAHIENAGTPRALPRVTQDIAHMANLTALVKELRAQGYRVTVAGDFNWAWKLGKVWQFAPRVTFRGLGMYVNWQNDTAPAGGSLGSRRIDYLAHSAEDLRIAGQRILTGEHSDHRWIVVSYKVVD